MSPRRITGMHHYTGDGCISPHEAPGEAADPALLRQRPGDQRLPVEGQGEFSHYLVIRALRERFPGEEVLGRMCFDVEERRQLGIRRYGKALQAHNGRDVLLDLYEEVLDALAYAATALEEFKDDFLERIDLAVSFDQLMLIARTVRKLRDGAARR